MTSYVDPDEYDDPENPPPGGYQPIPCPDCSEDHLKNTTQRMAVGPIRSTGVGTGSAVSFCPRCRGRRWVWYRALDT
jgi:hypothetical protein